MHHKRRPNLSFPIQSHHGRVQAIILAGGRGAAPANGKPLLWYQLHLLETSGFTEVLVLTIPDLLPLPGLFDPRIRRQNPRGAVRVTDNTETADHCERRSAANVADFHRINDASVTMLLRQEAPASKAKGEKPRRDKDMTDCIALVEGQRDEENRVVLVSQAVHMNEDLYVAKSLLKRRSNFVLHTDLYDGHFYFFSHWKKYIASIKADLIPHLVRRQFRGKEALPEGEDKATSKQELAASLSLSEEKHDPEDLVRCFAYVLPSNAYCERADTIPAYRAMDEEVGSRLRIKRSGSISN
ncbi:Nucleotide-diphospho-sugar transferase [Phytophthora cactorum]|nr:Nucleotide-diphospho-sugar transferase [Phytophthora cactorum]